MSFKYENVYVYKRLINYFITYGTQLFSFESRLPQICIRNASSPGMDAIWETIELSNHGASLVVVQ